MVTHRTRGTFATLLGSATPFFVVFLAAQEQHADRALFPMLRGCTGGGAPISVELARRVRRELLVPGVANAWGLTEFPVATSPPLDAPEDVLDYTVGRPVAGVQVRVVGPDGCDAPVDGTGELRL